MATFSVILAAAGKSSRFRDKNYKKPFAPLADRAVWLHSAEKFLNRDDVKQLILVISPEDRETFDAKFAANVAILGIQVVPGGAGTRRLDRQRAGTRAAGRRFRGRPRRGPPVPGQRVDRSGLRGRREDAARRSWPSRSPARSSGSAPISGSSRPSSRTGLWEAQTPQVFRRQLLLDAYARRGRRAGHRRRGTGRATGAAGHDRARARPST